MHFQINFTEKLPTISPNENPPLDMSKKTFLTSSSSPKH